MEFALPIRVRWGIDFRGSSGRAKRIARHIRELRPLAVELRIDGPKGCDEFPAVFNEIRGEGSRVEVGIRLFPGAAGILRWGYPVRTVWEVAPEGPFSAGLPEGADAMSFSPDDESIGALPPLIDDFAAGSARELHILNMNAVRSLAARGHVAVPSAARLRAVAAEVAAAGAGLEGKRLVVHDYFLWRLLRPLFPGAVGERVEFAGCQAGSALAYIDWNGDVYPCDSLPVLLGNILETPFERIWDSPARRSLAASIRSTPDACGGCRAYAGCRSGCRGTAFLASGDLDSPDPGCPGPEADEPEG